MAEDPIKKAAYMKRWRAENRDKIKARSKRQAAKRRGDPEYRAYMSDLRKRIADRPHNRESVRRSAAACRERHPHKQYARHAVLHAVRMGRLVKPDSCTKCGSNKKIQAHHNDYSSPLDVQWLCIPCHNEVHHAVP